EERCAKQRRAPKGPSSEPRREARWSSVAAAPAAAAPASAGHGGRGAGRDQRSIGLHPEDGQLARNIRAAARGTRDLGRRAGEILLEVLPAAAAAILVDGHGVTRRPAARSS